MDSISASISDLGADDYERRRSAFIEIWKHGRPALEAVRQAMDSSDLQVSQAAKVLERLLIMDVGTDEFGPMELQVLIKPSMSGIAELCERGGWDLAQHLLLTDTDLNQQFRNPENLGTYYLNRIAEYALAQGDIQLVWPLVRSVTEPSPAEYDGSSLNVWLAEKLQLDLLPETERDTDVQAQRMFYGGKSEQALGLPISKLLRRKILTRGHRWSELGEAQNLESLLGARDSLASRASEAVLLEFAGNLRAANALWSEILGFQESDVDPSGKQRPAIASKIQQAVPAQQSARLILALILGGHIEPVEEYFSAYQRDVAFSFYAAGNDYAAALRAVDLEPDLSNFELWIRLRENLISQDITQFSQTAHVCSLLTGLGFRDEARRVLDMLADLSEWKANLWTRSGSIISWMGHGEQRVLCLEAVESHFNKMPRETQSEILKSLYPEFRNLTESLASTAPGFMADDGRQVNLLEKLERLHAWDRDYFIERVGPNAVADWLVRAERRLIAEQTAIRNPLLYIEQICELCRLAEGCGLSELALRFAEVDTRDLGAPERTLQAQWIEAARIHLEHGDATQAAKRLEQVRKLAVSRNNQTAFMSEVTAQLLDGRYEEALELDRSRWLRPLAVTRFYRGPFYSQVVEQLVEVGDFSNARDYADLAFMLSDYASMDAYWAASDLAEILIEEDDYQSSAAVLRAPLAEALGESSSMLAYIGRNNFYSSLRYAAQKERVHHAVACIMRDEIAHAKRHMEVASRLQPQDIELVVQCYPRLIQHDQAELAEKFFTQFESEMNEQIGAWPKDATALNNLAWMYAKCDRKLDEALALSRRAVELAPRSAVYLDTLAEVYYRRGETGHALELTQQCVRIDPRDLNYRKNLKRFAEPAN